MIPLAYGKCYKVPECYQPSEESDLAQNTEHPNLNSRDYAKRPLNHTTRMYNVWECIAISSPNDTENGNIVLACNKMHGREWTSSLWGFEKADVVKHKYQVNSEMACYKLQCNALITCMEFVSDNILLLAMNSGKVQVWSTYSEVRNSTNPYCLFLIRDQCKHMKPITSMTSSTDSVKAITGDKDGSMKIWSMSDADLCLTYSFCFAHIDAITGLTANARNCSIFATCSLDKSSLLWDDRETRPAIALYENHTVRFKDVSWSLENVDNIIYLGDESGQILVIDSRKPNAIVKCVQYFDHPIRKIKPNGDNVAVIGDSTIVKISKSNYHDIFYENADSKYIVRDCNWFSSKELLSVGFCGKLRRHEID